MRTSDVAHGVIVRFNGAVQFLICSEVVAARGCRVIAAYRLVGCMFCSNVVFKFGTVHVNFSTKGGGSNAENTVAFLKFEMVMILKDLPTSWSPLV